MMWNLYGTKDIDSSGDGFWTALQIWLNKPHVVNRRLCGSQNVEQTVWYISPSNVFPVPEVLRKIKDEFCSRIFSVETSGKGQEKQSVESETDMRMLSELALLMRARVMDNVEGHINMTDILVMLRDHLPKQTDRYPVLRELILLDRANLQAVFIPLAHHREGQTQWQPSYDVAYAIQHNTQDKKLNLYSQACSQPVEGASLGCTEAWLLDTLLQKLSNWSRETSLNTEITSLRLINVQKYNDKYQELKVKYGLDLVKGWTEGTDPQKFVFEDVAIAAYLLTLWEEERKELGTDKKQSFVDLGCGNGLLVYLLAKQGHPGVGLDIRRRKIWDMLTPDADLKEFSITPSDGHLFPEYDWLIGNHSDELTPWIPVMASRSSSKCKYFVLPCCAHDFDSKFSEKQPGLSQYRCYLNYVQRVGEVCGFNVQEDTLRIPSTKKVCFIGKSRTYAATEEADMDSQRTDFIKSRSKQIMTEGRDNKVDDNICRNCGKPIVVAECGEQCHCSEAKQSRLNGASNVTHGAGGSDGGGCWASSFQARSSVEVPRNCALVAQSVKDDIMLTVFTAVLQAHDGRCKTLPGGRTWNAGGSLGLGDAAALIDSSLLQKLKNECGGLQTLLKNSNHVFRVQSGRVHLREWGDDTECQFVRKKMKRKGGKATDHTRYIKTKLCWFHAHHPDSCPRASADCDFAHGETELRPKPIS